MSVFEVRELDAGIKLKNMIGEFVVAPGVFNTLSALFAKKHGFKALYLSSHALTIIHGFHHPEILSTDLIVDVVRCIYSATDLPVIVDLNTCLPNLGYAVQMLEMAGAAAVVIDDRTDYRGLLPAERMKEKIQVVIESRKRLMVIAKTTSRVSEGLRDAIERAKIYSDSGADVVSADNLISRDEFLSFRQNVSGHLSASMTETGLSPYLTADDLKEMGYNAVFFPTAAVRMTASVVEETYRTLQATGSQRSILHKMMSDEELNQVLKPQKGG